MKIVGRMEFPKEAIFTPYNYFAWEAKMDIFLRSRGLYRISMATEFEPTTAIENSKYLNQMDEAYRALYMNISAQLLFIFLLTKLPMNFGPP